MRNAAIVQSQERLAKAKVSLGAMKNAKSYPAFQIAWSDFLIAAGGVYSKLEKGSKGCGQSEPWFGRKKHDRKTDELLSYLHHARNTDEHGIEPTTEHQGRIELGGNGYIRSVRIGADGQVQLDGDAGTHAAITSKAVLAPVFDDRYGDTFQVPTTHLGLALQDPSPISVAELAVAYLEGLLAEGTQLPQRA